ncbi:MAG: hypothetical protein V4541_05970 [Bacteroidota bacterium]
MSNVYYKLILVFLLFVMQIPFNAGAQVLKTVQTAFESYRQNVFQEKMFVHTDKEQYIAGELLWFKAYNVDAATGLPADLSKLAYIELIDRNNQPVIQTKIELKNGKGSGSIYIPLTLNNGSYKLRGYTNWMQNFGANYFFEKQIILINTLHDPEKINKITPEQDLQFFPEGGELIEGITCNVGFKALGIDGKGMALKGVIINQKNDTVARFQTFKFGIGQFSFTPQANQKYKAIAGNNKKEIIIRELPTAKKQGYSIWLKESGSGPLTLNVSTNLTDQNVYLFVHDGAHVSLAQMATIVNGQASFDIERSKLNEGVSHLTIFNPEGRPVAERLFFKKPNKQLQISARSDLSIYNTREKINLNILAKNEKNQAIDADISLAVRKLDSLQGMDESDIVSYFWLSSELKGNIESPGYYFTNNTSESSQALDNLLITQGWRRFTWNDLLEKKPVAFKFLPEFNGHLITGKVTSSNGPKETKLYLTIPGSITQFYTTDSDMAGNFMFNTKDFYGPNEIIVQTNATVDTTSVISIRSPFSEDYNTFNFPELPIAASLLNKLQDYSFGMQVQNIYAANKLKQFYSPRIDTLNFYGKPFKTYNLDDYTRFSLMEDVLREYVSETFVSKAQKNFRIKVLGKVEFMDGEPLILLDGAPYFNTNKAMQIDPKKVKKLDIIREPYYYGSSMFDGILSFSSFKTNLANLDINPSAIVLDYDGMQLQREFYAPSYDGPGRADSRLPDFRNVLYWSPSIQVDEKGKEQISFYTSDLPGTYVGIMNGISKDGVPGSSSFIFRVKEK